MCKHKPRNTKGAFVLGHYRALDMFTIFFSLILFVMPSSCLRCYTCSTTTYDRFKKVQQLIFAKITPPIHENKPSLFVGDYTTYMRVSYLRKQLHQHIIISFLLQESRTQEGLCADQDTVGPIVKCTDPRQDHLKGTIS